MAKKVIVIYKSKYGFTSKYAKLISDILKCELISADKVTLDDCKSYDTIIYGGGIYAFRINGLEFIKNNFDELKNKNIVVLATGFMKGKKEYSELVFRRNFPKNISDNIKFFHLRGGFDFSKLSFKDKMIIRLLGFKIKHSNSSSEEEKELLQAMYKPINYCSKENVSELISYVRNL